MRIAIIAQFQRRIQDAVAAATERAIGTAGGIGVGGILQSRIAVFTRIKNSVAAELGDIRIIRTRDAGNGGRQRLADALHARLGPALRGIRTRRAPIIETQARRTLRPLRATNARSVDALLVIGALRIVAAEQTQTVAAEPSRALIILRAIDALAVAAQIALTL